jgi:hypothetical protein
VSGADNQESIPVVRTLVRFHLSLYWNQHIGHAPREVFTRRVLDLLKKGKEVAKWERNCSESLRFIGMAISACLLPSSPRPTCTADSSAALTATAPVRFLVHTWPCSAPPRPLLPLPFPAPPLLIIFCAHLTFHHSLSCPISHFPPRFPHAFLTALCPFWHICCLGTGFERLPLVRLPCWRYSWKRLILFFLKSPRTLPSDYFT